jgi:hypothetical protein
MGRLGIVAKSAQERRDHRGTARQRHWAGGGTIIDCPQVKGLIAADAT